jgi:monoamine oxidase
MPHDPLTRLLQKAFASAARQAASAPAASVQATPGQAPEPRSLDRRHFLRQSALAAGALFIPPILRAGLTGLPPTGNKVVIVGAGMAGLNAAWQLKQQGIPSMIYEASARVGGRMFTIKDRFGPGLTTDIGGEFVDSTHSDILALVKQLNLNLYDLHKDDLTPKTFWFEGRLLGEKDLREALAPYITQLMKDIHSFPAVISHETAAGFRQFDEMTILEYLRSIGVSGWLLKFLDVVLTREYGMEAAEQSAINFLIMFEAPAPADSDYELFGQDHEVFKIQGGSQHLTDVLYAQVRDQVVLQQRLIAIHPNPHRGYDLHFESATAQSNPGGPDTTTPQITGSQTVIQADHVILTIPFTILRTIDLTVPMPAAKRKCIDEIGYGNSCKFIMGVREKPWRQAGRQGYTFTDLSFGCGWDSSQLQSDHEGSFTVFGGGHFAEDVQKTKGEELAGQYLSALDTIHPGAAKAYTGKYMKYCWAGHPYSRAGYSSFKRGQWSTLAGWEGWPIGNIYFAGEHVSREFQGYMNGAAQTGRVAAEAIIKKLTIAHHE